jgi:hypothetical protein
MCMISMVDNEVDDAIWVSRKLLQGVAHEIHRYQNLAACRVHQSNEPATCIG